MAQHGIDSFYDGWIRDSLLETINSHEGIMTAQDFSNYTAEHQLPISTTYKNFTITSLPAPASGNVVIQALSILNGYKDSFKNENETWWSALGAHRFVESLKFSYSGRTYLGDPNFEPHVRDMEFKFRSSNFTDQCRANITDVRRRRQSWSKPFLSSLNSHFTSHLPAP